MAINLSTLQTTLEMFVFLAVELSLLFLVISYFVGILQEKIPPEKIKQLLSQQKGKGYLFASFLGAITPFCSCSTIPFLKGLMRAQAGFGPMMVFLFSSPLLNPLIIGLFALTFGIKVTLFYFFVAMSVSVLAGFSLEKLGFEKYIRPESYIEFQSPPSLSNPSQSNPSLSKSSLSKPYLSKQCQTSCQTSCHNGAIPLNRWLKIWNSVWADFKKVLPYLFLGVTLGSLIYGFMPTDFVARVANEDNPLAIPIAAVIGIPLYIRTEALIPLSSALALKGMGLGAIMALIIGSAGASITEVILLKAIFKNPLIIAFIGVVITMAIAAGYFYTIIF